MDNTDYDYLDNPYQAEQDPCPDCKAEAVISYYEANGPDDYRKVWECVACGATLTN